MCFLFALVTGNCDVLERAPVLLIALQCQFLGSGKYIKQTEVDMLDFRWKKTHPLFFISGQEGEWGRGDHRGVQKEGGEKEGISNAMSAR